jgi:HEPN domain-containing protein
MKTALPAKSQTHQSRIEEITEIIVKASKGKAAFVILFGPFACGDWVRYRYNEAGVTYEYASDYNFLVVTNGNNSCKSFDLERKIKRKISSSTLTKEAHSSHIIIEPINRVNSDLEKSQDFFSDIKRAGVLLYDSGEFELSASKGFDKEKKERDAKADYEHWFNGADGFLTDHKTALERNDHKKSSFYLHQAAESLYSCALLTLGGYKPKSHDLEELNQICSFYSNDFLTVFPKASGDQRECFELLQKSYIDARYSKNFNIEKRQLKYLTSRVEGLRDLVARVCE